MKSIFEEDSAKDSASEITVLGFSQVFALDGINSEANPRGIDEEGRSEGLRRRGLQSQS